MRKRLRLLWYRLSGLARRRSREDDMQAEMQAHLEGLAQRKIAAGMSPDEARYAARREFGGVAQIAEQARDVQRFLWLEQLVQDLRYAVRSLSKSPTLAMTAVLTLALGIGVNAALFSVFNMLMKPLPLREPDRLVALDGFDAQGRRVPGFNHAEYVAYAEASRTLTGVLATRSEGWWVEPRAGKGGELDRDFDATGGGAVAVSMVSPNYFELLGGRIQMGRTFSAEENATAAPVAVLCHRFWEEHFEGDSEVLGTTLVLNGRTFTVIGVAAPEFAGAGQLPPAAWVPFEWANLRPEDRAPDGPNRLDLVARLAPGVTEAQAKSELDAIAARRAVQFPGDTAKTSVRIRAGLRFVNIPVTPQSLFYLSPLFLGFGMVLALACTNVANLLLARGIARQAEIGVRLTLGASRGRIVRQLITENALLCAAGAVAGLALGTWTLQLVQHALLTQFLPPSLVLSLRPSLDLRVLGYTAILTAVATLMAGLLPAVHTARASVFAMTRNEGISLVPRLSPSRLRRWLVIGQVGFCVTLLSCAGVLVRNLFELQRPEYGPNANVIFPATVIPDAANTDRGAAFRRACETVSSTPGVVAVALNHMVGQTRLRLDAATARDEERVLTAFVSANAFELFGIRVSAGRAFQELDQHSASRAVIVSESLAQRLWPGQDVVGKSVQVSETAWGASKTPAAEEVFRECEVVGVARDVVSRVRGDDRRRLYLPFRLDGSIRTSLLVQTRNASGGTVREITRAVEARGLGIRFQPSLAYRADQEFGPYRGLAGLSTGVAALALVMAVVGLYGLMAFTVSQRSHEIGVRLAVGATAGHVVAHLLREGMRVVVVGLALGLVGGGLFAALLGKIFYGYIDAFDPLDLIVVTVFFGMLALLACWLPARRSAKLDPMAALRTE